MKNMLNLLFFLCLFISTFICISSNSWLSIWIGLEMNLLSFIPLINNNMNLMSNEASLKYFLTQALASILLLFFICINFLNHYFSLSMYNDIYMLMINSSLLIKMGAAPFHFWFPSIVNNLNWNNNFIMMTWQKINPFVCLSYYMSNKFILYIAMISIIIGSLGGFSSTSMRKIMAFSSISHIGWMLMALISSEMTFWFYFVFYTFMTLSLIFILNKFMIYWLNQLMLSPMTKFNKFIFSSTMLSMGGLPPFLGFFPKWFIINKMMMMKLYIPMLIMVIMTLITLYFYFRISFSMLILNYYQMYWKFNFNSSKYMYTAYIMLLFYPLFYWLM